MLTLHLISGVKEAFGFSVALHKGSTVNYLLVGAPAAQTGQEGVATGTIFGPCGRLRRHKAPQPLMVILYCFSFVAKHQDDYILLVTILGRRSSV